MVFGQSRSFIDEVDEKDKPTDPIILDAFNQIWEKLQSEIFIWDKFRTCLPFQVESPSENSEEKQKIRSLEEQHRHDLQAMCFDEKGNRKRLSKQQLNEISDTGRFTVKSEIGEQYDNVWLLGSFLQLGRKEISRRFKKRKNSANEHWFLHLPECFSENGRLTLRRALRNMNNSLAHVVRLLVGLPEYRPRYSERLIDVLMQKDRILYLFAEARPEADNDLQWIYQNQLKLNTLLVKPEIIEQLKEVINQVTETLNEKGEIDDSALLLALKEHPKTRELDAELPALLENFHSFYFMLSRQNPRFDVLLKIETEKRERLLIDQYPYRGRYEKWRRIHLNRQSGKIVKQVKQQLAEELLEKLPAGQEKYCLQRNLSYFSTCGEVRKNHLKLQFFPSVIFKLPRIKWSFRPLSKYDNLAFRNIHFTGKHRGWRMSCLFLSAYTAFFNNTLKLMRAWRYNPFGMRSVLTFSREKFNGEFWLTDKGVPIGSGKYATHITDLYDRWKLLRRYREDFEAKSDFGLFPRSVGRLFNRFYCYVMIGLIGGSIVMLLRYAGFALFSLFVVTVLLLAPLLALLYVVLMFLFNTLIYDHIGPGIYYNGRKAKHYTALFPLISTLLYSFFIRGFLLAVISVAVIILHVLATPLLSLLAFLAYAFRSFWDLLMRLLFIMPFARIPGDNFPGLVQRISGYGIASEVLNQIDVSDAMGKYQQWLEAYILDEYQPVLLKSLHQFEARLEQMMTEAYRGIVGDRLQFLQQTIEENINEFQQPFENALSKHRSELRNKMMVYESHYLRLNAEALPEFIEASEKLTQSYVENSLLAYMSDAQIVAFWSLAGINKNEWSLLNRVLLSRAFSADIFTPIEECDGSIMVQNSQQNVVQSLLLEKEPSSKVVFDVNGEGRAPETEHKLSFDDNPFWYELYEPYYLPVETPERWKYLMRLRQRFIIKMG